MDTKTADQLRAAMADYAATGRGDVKKLKGKYANEYQLHSNK